jgi:AAA domain
MTTEAISASAAGHNVYCEGRTVRSGLNGKQRGELGDTAAVFSLTVDSDADKGAAWMPTVPTSLAVETSPNNAHYWFFLDKAVDSKTGQALGERLRAAVKADSDTGNICQPYRVCGAVNYPNKKKIERGRVVTPTRSLGFDPETLWTPERFKQEFPDIKTNGGGQANGAVGAADEANIPADTMRVIRDGVQDGARSNAFWNVVKMLKEDGWTLAGIVRLFDRFPNGIASKYRGRLQREVERVWNKLGGDQQQQQQPRRFELKPFSTITVSTAPNYLVKGILPRTGLVVVWGPPKCGKSFWTFDLMMHVAIGRPYRGRKVQQGGVLYLALEGGSGFANRVEAWRRRNLADRKTSTGVPFMITRAMKEELRVRGYSDEDIIHTTPQQAHEITVPQSPAVPFYLLDVPIDLIAEHKMLITDVRAQVNGIPAIVVIDTLNRAIVGDENRSDDMAKFIRAADALRMAFGCLVIVVHHCGVVGNRPRGHTSLAGADDAQIVIERDKEGIITATVEHMKDGEAGAVLASRLEPIELGTDADGDPISSCVIVAAAAGAKGPKLSKVNRFAFDLLQKLIANEGIEAPAEAKLPEDKRVISSETWRKEFYAAYPADKQDTKKKALLRATLDLEELKLIELWREFVWLSDQRDKRDKSDA